MEAELNEELADFDRLLLKEQETLAQNRPAAASADGGSGGSGSGSGAGGGSASAGSSSRGSSSAGSSDSRPSDGGEAATGASSSGSSREADSGGSVGGGSGNTDAGHSERVPGDIPDGHDDDIVARQLREAAMNEEDPELRERLWEEYRAYKNGRRAARGGDRDANTEENPR